MKHHRLCMFLFCTLTFTFVIVPGFAQAQPADSIDNGYYVSYPNEIMLRLYLSQKYAPFTVPSPINEEELNYKTNSKLSLGAGVTYRSVTLNLSYGFSFLNKDKGRGITKGLDFQFHLYPHKWAVDLLGSFKKGYYIDPKNNSGLNLRDNYLRPDINRDIIGVSVYRVLNSGRFSYRAALAQNDRQIKSAGSLLFGGEAYYGAMKGDSALVPNKAADRYPQAGITKVNFISIGPGAGYAYTLVIAKFFFVTGSAIANLNLNFSTEKKPGSNMKATALTPDFIYKASVGYNSDTWSVSANILGNALYVASKTSAREYFLPTGNLRFMVTKKLGNRR